MNDKHNIVLKNVFLNTIVLIIQKCLNMLLLSVFRKSILQSYCVVMIERKKNSLKTFADESSRQTKLKSVLRGRVITFSKFIMQCCEGE